MRKKILLKKVVSLGIAMVGATILLAGCGKAKGESEEEIAV